MCRFSIEDTNNIPQIEVHPNVDKRSFIRAKQNQIHQNRAQRKHQIDTFKYERIINDGLLQRINSLLKALRSHTAEAEKRSPDELMFQAIMEAAGESENDAPPPPPAGVHTSEKDKEPLTYSKMMSALVDQVKAKVDEKNGKPENRFEAYITEVKEHQTKVQELQKELLVELNKLEIEEGRKITSESIHTGFDSSYVNKSHEASSKTASKSKVQAVELLNPSAPTLSARDAESSGADADVDEPRPGDSSDEEDVQASSEGKKFANINPKDYRASLEFISKNSKILAEKETDGLLVMAFNAAIDAKDEFARQCVHQALLLQYCRSLGRDGVGLFFKRITTPGHQAQKVFYDDVNDTFNRIRSRAREISKQREKEEAEGRKQM